MKIEQKEEVFSPVTITLETQEEVDQMYSIMYWTCIVTDDDNSIDIEIEQYLFDKISKDSPAYNPENRKGNFLNKD
jgi:hypothetical protein